MVTVFLVVTKYDILQPSNVDSIQYIFRSITKLMIIHNRINLLYTN